MELKVANKVVFVHLLKHIADFSAKKLQNDKYRKRQNAVSRALSFNPYRVSSTYTTLTL